MVIIGWAIGMALGQVALQVAKANPYPEGGLRDTALHRHYDRERIYDEDIRNLVFSGIPAHFVSRPATAKEIAVQSRRDKRKLSLFYSERRATDLLIQTTAVGPMKPTNATPSAGGPEQFIQCESKGDPNAVNPSSGAFGLYQLKPMHFQAGGICEGVNRDQGGQSTCANKVYEEQGSGAWSECGG